MQKYGYTNRNLTALQALDAVRRLVLADPSPAYPPYQPPCDPNHCAPIPYGPIPYPPIPYGVFPCTKPYFNESNLCILQPYPVKIGTTAYAVLR